MVQLNDLILLIDDRERAVFPHLELDAAEINYKKQRMTVGDYAIVTSSGEIVAVIERKSLTDFGASFKDGRYLNRNSMIELREQSNCRVIYLIEGPSNPSPKATFARVPFGAIESAIFHMMMRDNIFPIYSLNTKDSIVKLVRFMKSMVSLMNKTDLQLKTSDKLQMTTDADANAAIAAGDAVAIGSFEMPASLNKKIEKSDIDIVRHMWAAFPGISVISADNFITQRISIGSIVRGDVDVDFIKSIRTPNGRNLTRKVINSLSTLVLTTDKSFEIRLLERIPGLSKASAGDMLKTCTLRQLLSYEAGAIGMIKIGKAQSRAGEKRAEKILKYFNWVIPPVATAASSTADTLVVSSSTDTSAAAESSSVDTIVVANEFLKSL